MSTFSVRRATLQPDGPLVDIYVGVTLLVARQWTQQGMPLPNPVPVTALIDTGASGSVIRAGIPQQLGLNPINQVSVVTPSGTAWANQYDVRLDFPNNAEGEFILTEMPLPSQQIDCLIGRDLLKYGVLVYMGLEDTFSLSF